MATCYDCIHCDVCYHIEHYGRHMETEEPCGGFKNKSDFVEVVRCKDCNNAKPLDNLGNYHCRAFNITVVGLRYCNLGERKKNDLKEEI